MGSDDITAALEAAKSDLEAFDKQVLGKELNLAAQAAQIRIARELISMRGELAALRLTIAAAITRFTQ